MRKCLLSLIVVVVVTATTSAETLDSTRIHSLDEVVVQSTRLGSTLKNTPQKIEIITQEDIQGVPNENLAEVIKRLSNVDIIQYPGASATIGMRGFSPSAHSRSYTLLLINGRPAGTNNLAAILPSNIERIEVIKGPYATLYGSDAMGGVLNIVTKTIDTAFHDQLKAEMGSFGFYRLDGGLSGRVLRNLRAGFHFSGMKQANDYRIGGNNLLKTSYLQRLILDNKSYSDSMRNSCYDIKQLNSRLEWDIAKSWKANAEGTYTHGENIETPGNYWGSYGYSKKQIRRYNVYGSIERKTKNGILSLSPYFTKENEPTNSDNTAKGFVSFESELTEYGFQLQQQYQFNRFKAVVGYDYGVYDYHSERFKSKGTPDAPYKPDNRHQDNGIFGQLNFHYEKLDINAGARIDFFHYQVASNEALHSVASSSTYKTLNPSLGIQYFLLDGLKGHSSFGTAFSVPDAYKTSGSYSISVIYPKYTFNQAYAGNPNLKPEKSATLDMGVNLVTPDKSFDTDLTYFRTKHSNKIVDLIRPDKTKTYENANSSDMDGLEYSANLDLGVLLDKAYSLNLYTNWTYLFNARFSQIKVSKSGKDSACYRDLTFVRKLNGHVGLAFRNRYGFTARLNARYNGSRLERDNFEKLRPEIKPADYTTEGGYTSAEKILKLPEFLVLDLSANYTFRKKWSVGFMVSNLCDDNYSDKDGYNLPGRQSKINLGYNF